MFDGDYHLGAGSACIDAGDNNAVPVGVITDIDGDMRFRDDATVIDTGSGTAPIVDMGAYERNDEQAFVACSPSDFRFICFEGNCDLDDEILLIANGGGGTVNWSISNDCSWLTLDPCEGSSTGEIDEVTLSVNAGGLGVGSYTCTLEISDPCALNSPQEVSVELNIGDTLHVPSQHSTIQAAIDAANNGDTIVVGAGRYFENIDFMGKAIKVRSVDPHDRDVVDTTIIDGNSMGSCVVFANGEDNESILEGFTLTGGTGTYTYYFTLSGTYVGFPGEYVGGGVYCRDSSPTIRYCNISGNIYNDIGPNHGGGIALIGDCRAKILNCLIIDNSAGGGGNSESGLGYGIFIRSSAPNFATTTIANCTIAGNRRVEDDYTEACPECDGYEVDSWDCRPSIVNTIIYSNSDSGEFAYYSHDYYDNSRSLLIIDANLVTNSCVNSTYIFEGHYPTYDEDKRPYDLSVAGGNVKYPFFVQPFELEGQGKDYRILSNSQCINAGDPNFAAGLTTDSDGQPRVMAGRIDIGAYEAVPQIQVTRPGGGEIWIAGSLHEILWSSYGAGTVDILVSGNGGDSWVPIVSGAADTENFMWRTPRVLDSNQCMVKVIPSIADPNVVCVESGLFTLKPDSPPHPMVPSKWKTLGGDYRRRGLSKNRGPEIGCVKWEFEAGGAVTAGVAIGVGGHVVAACEDGKVYTLDANGTLLWSYDTNAIDEGSQLVSSPTIGPDGSVYVGSINGKLYAIDIEGNLRWVHDTGGIVFSSPVVTNRGKVYGCSQDGSVYCLGADGSELWKFKTAGVGNLDGGVFASPALGADGTVYVGGLYDSNLYAIDGNDGSLEWVRNFEGMGYVRYWDGYYWQEYPVEKAGWCFGSPIVGANETIYQSLMYDPNLYAVDANDGSIIWSVDLSDVESGLFEAFYHPEDVGHSYSLYHVDGWSLSEAVLGPDGTIYVSFEDPYLRAVDPNGSIKWVTRLGMTGGFTLTVGSDGLIYAAGGAGDVYVVGPYGDQLAVYTTGQARYEYQPEEADMGFYYVNSKFQQIETESQLGYPVIAGENMLLISDSNNIVRAIGFDGCGIEVDLHRSEDLDGNRRVDFRDYATLANDWLGCTDRNYYIYYAEGWPCDYPAMELFYLEGDVNRDMYIDLTDIAAIANRWLIME